MTRIEEIKKKCEEYGDDYFVSREEVEYLLYNLYIAEEALRKISGPMPGSRDNQLVLYYERTATETLAKLRK